MYRLDRRARSLTIQEAVLGHVWRHSGTVFAVDTGAVQQDDPADPMRTFVRQVMGAAHQLERGLIAARMRAGRDLKTDRCGYAGFGSPPFGLRAEGKNWSRSRPSRSPLSASLNSAAKTAHCPRSSRCWRPRATRRSVGSLASADHQPGTVPCRRLGSPPQEALRPAQPLGEPESSPSRVGDLIGFGKMIADHRFKNLSRRREVLRQ